MRFVCGNRNAVRGDHLAAAFQHVVCAANCVAAQREIHTDAVPYVHSPRSRDVQDDRLIRIGLHQIAVAGQLNGPLIVVEDGDRSRRVGIRNSERFAAAARRHPVEVVEDQADGMVAFTTGVVDRSDRDRGRCSRTSREVRFVDHLAFRRCVGVGGAFDQDVVGRAGELVVPRIGRTVRRFRDSNREGSRFIPRFCRKRVRHPHGKNRQELAFLQSFQLQGSPPERLLSRFTATSREDRQPVHQRVPSRSIARHDDPLPILN